jgi:hypothetical protein
MLLGKLQRSKVENTPHQAGCYDLDVIFPKGSCVGRFVFGVVMLEVMGPLRWSLV